MARRFTIELIINLAKSIGANPAKLAGTRSNISFLGKGPTKNPLFQNYLAGLENARPANLGDPKKLFEAIDDAVGWAKDGKLNSIQTEILGHNLSGIEKVLHPPVLPSASVTPIRSGITTLKSNDIGAGPRRYNELTGFNKPRPVVDDRGRTWKLTVPDTGAFQGWTPRVVRKVNMPASKVDHQRIANQYDFDVKLIKGKDWIETLKVVDTIFKARGWNVPTPKAEGGLARILEV